MVRIFKAEAEGDFANSDIGCPQQMFCLLEGGELDIFLGGLACGMLHQVAEVIGREAQTACTILDCGLTLLGG